MRGFRAISDVWIPTVVLAAILGGGVASAVGRAPLARSIWAGVTFAALLALAVEVVAALRRRRPGVDLLALLAMGGALALGEFLPGAVIALMLTGGQALERRASARARRELTALLERAPRVVHRYENGVLGSPEIGEIRAGDLLLVKSGEVVPVDGLLESEAGVLDESALTGEATPADRRQGEQVFSGTVNAGPAFDLRAIASASDSAYAGIVRLVEQAQVSRAPFVRLADRYALFLLPLTVGVALVAWAVSGEPVRALAVLVVATPCPLILAAPVAIVSGMSRCARRGVIVKGGAVLETLARARTLLLDKTGTLTTGTAVVSDVVVLDGWSPDEVLRLGASLDQVSAHVLATAIVRAAHERHLRLPFPHDVEEHAGKGIRGGVEGHEVALGKYEWVTGEPPSGAARLVRRRTAVEGSTNVFVAVDGKVAGALILQDPVRSDTPGTIRALRRSGIGRVVMVSGDHLEVAETVGIGIGADLVLAERSPEEKVAAVASEHAHGPTVKVGDGINDAPALAAADVGVALGARGATAAAQAADVVITVDRLDRLSEAIRIASRSRRIALQSVWVGMSLSFIAMGFAAAGWLPPLAGAILQEGIDVAVILNALRARGGGRRARSEGDSVVGEESRAEHRRLLPEVNRLRSVADRIDGLSPRVARGELDRLRQFLEKELVPHERQEDSTIYPVVARLIGGDDPTSTMSRAHLEIAHLVNLYGRLLNELPEEGPGPEDLHDLRRVLYGLHAILRLHFAQEEEHYFPLLDEGSRTEELSRESG